MTVPFLEALQPDLDEACETMISRRAKLVGIQLPEGLRIRFRELARYVESRTGAAAAMMVEMCCGACMAEYHQEFDLVVHVAHAELRPLGGAHARSPRVIFVRYQPALDIERGVRAAMGWLKPPVGVLTTSTHAGALPAVLNLLKDAGMEPVTAPCRRTGARAIVLGCDFSAARKIAAKVNSYLFVGSGSFHPVGVEIATGKPVVAADPYDGQVRTFAEVRDRILRRRFAAIELSRNANVFGVLLGLYPGQLRRRKALELKRLLEASGREAYILAARRFDPESVTHLGMEALVSTACSRIAVDDEARYPLPVLTPPELDIALGKKRWEDYRLDELG
jgi:2-(3-amino-3-carboxypropyl)histidine synthase